jgi:uncharacterized SAM-binding protein YcdF (DUF218 family)
MSRPAFCWRLGLAGSVLVSAVAFTPLPNLVGGLMRIPARLEPAGAIVVLAGGGLRSDGGLSNESLRRALAGIVLYRSGLAPFLVFSGEASDEGPGEADVRADLARRLGISAEAILTDADARTTREEAIRIRQLLLPRGVGRILLVTDSSHMLRARGVFERAGFDVLPAPAGDASANVTAPAVRLRVALYLVRELLALLYYRVAGYL